MELINQHTKKIMEGCKERARAEGLVFQDETLEYIVTNKDLLELGPKVMIPTMYDYWVHDIEVLKEKGKYELYPSNPYETVINTRPPISFYNDNNPDWLNVMIFYHVLAHIDFFQNNLYFKHTWSEDFEGKALSDKRLIARLRSEKGRQVDYVIEFTRAIDNILGYYSELSRINYPRELSSTKKIDFYFDVFLQEISKAKNSFYLKEIERFNEVQKKFGEMAESVFFAEVTRNHPEFEAMFERHSAKKAEQPLDIIQYLQEYSPFLQKEENKWMKSVMEIIRDTSLVFQPQIRTKILNEGWASYWHEKLFLKDDRIRGNEVSFAIVNAKVTSLPRVGLNPYALGMRMFYHIEEMADKGRMSYEFQRMKDDHSRKNYDKKTGEGKDFVFSVRENFSDFMFINQFIDQDFMDRYRIFITGRRLNSERQVWEYYVKSRDAAEYRDMVLASLYHPPYITIDRQKTEDGVLYLNHVFEGKPLVREYIPNTMMGIEYLWGGVVKLETTEIVEEPKSGSQQYYQSVTSGNPPADKEVKYNRALYTMEKRKITKTIL